MSTNKDEPTGPELDDNVVDLAEELARRRANEGEPRALTDEQIEQLYMRCVEILHAQHVETLGDFGVRPIPCADLAVHVLHDLGTQRVEITALAYHSVGERIGEFDRFQKRLREYLRNDMQRDDTESNRFSFTSIMRAEIVLIRQRLRGGARGNTQSGFTAHPRSDGDIAPGMWPNLGAVVAAFNKRHAVTMLGGTTVVAERTKRKRKSTTSPIIFVKYHAFKERYANVLLPNPNQRGNSSVSGTEAWFTHPNRKQYLDGVVFEPRRRVADGELNLWRGFGLALDGFSGYELPNDMASMPRPRGAWGLMRRHILNYLCGGRRDVYHYVIMWCARVVQRPWEKGLTFISITGPEGAGKGIFGSTLVRLLGEHGKHFTSPRFFEGQFNAQLESCVFALFDESTFAGSARQANKLKGMATEDDMWIEKKGIDAYPVANVLHMMFLTNEEHAAKVSPDSRRTVMLKALATMVGNLTYFKKIIGQLRRNDDSGYKAMLWDLLTMDISKFEVMDIPRTAALAEQRHLSLEGPAAWLADVLDRGFVYRSRLGLSETFRRWNLAGNPGDEGEMQVSTALMHADYMAWRREAHDRTPAKSQQRLAMWIQNKFKWTMVERRGQIVGEEMRTDGATTITDKCRVICLPELSQARAQFRTEMGLEQLEEPIVGIVEEDREPPPPPQQDEIPF